MKAENVNNMNMINNHSTNPNPNPNPYPYPTVAVEAATYFFPQKCVIRDAVPCLRDTAFLAVSHLHLFAQTGVSTCIRYP